MSDNENNELLEAAIHDLDDKHLLCRDFGHRWSLQAHHSRLVATMSEAEVAVVERVVRCTVCRCTRTEQIDRRTGDMIRRYYVYPSGYRFEPGIAGRGGMAKGPFRREWISRTAPEREDDDE